MSRDQDVVVIGAGVSGLTTAVCLAEAGFPIKIISSGTGSATTSFAAGATWSPYLVEWTDRSRAWSFETLDELRALAAEPDAGIELVAGMEAAPEPVEPPEWHDRLDGFRMVTDSRRALSPDGPSPRRSSTCPPTSATSRPGRSGPARPSSSAPCTGSTSPRRWSTAPASARATWCRMTSSRRYAAR